MHTSTLMIVCQLGKSKNDSYKTFFNAYSFYFMCYSANFRNVALFSDPKIQRLRRAVTIVHPWDDSKYFDVSNLSGIPAHIVNYVNHEKLTRDIHLRFNEYATLLKTELDKRQMGGNMTMELIHDKISAPLLEQILLLKETVEKSIVRTREEENGSEQEEQPVFYWSEEPLIPRFLPENFELCGSIPPLLIWQQWHHGLTVGGGIAVGGLKHIRPKHNPAKKNTANYRIFNRMRSYCKKLDEVLGVKNTPTHAELGTLFNSNAQLLRENNLLLPIETPKGKKRKRNENGWDYIARNFELIRKLTKKAVKQGRELKDLIEEERIKERDRQAAKRARQKESVENATDDEESVQINRTTQNLQNPGFDASSARTWFSLTT